MADVEIPARLREKLDTLQQPAFENRVEFMYVDSVGKVTLGVGHNLTDLSATERTDLFKTRKFIVKRVSRALDRLGHAAQARVKNIAVPKPERLNLQATADEIHADYDYLAELSGLKSVSVIAERHKMQIQTTVEMDSGDIDALFEADLKKFYQAAKDVFTDFGTFPVPCQAALIDLLFNYGKGSAVGKHKGGFLWHKRDLIHAINGDKAPYTTMSMSARWVEASKLCSRTSANADRNSTVSGWFIEGSKETAAKP